MEGRGPLIAAGVSAACLGVSLYLYLQAQKDYRAAVADAKTVADAGETAAAAAKIAAEKHVKRIEGKIDEEVFARVFGELLKQLEHWILQLMGQVHQILAAAKGKTPQEMQAVQQQVQMMYGAQVDGVVQKLMKEVYPACGVADTQMRDYIKEHENSTMVKSMIAKMKEITTGVINIPDDEFPDKFDMAALKEMVMAQKALKVELKEKHCARMEAEGKSVSEHSVKVELEKLITEDFKKKNIAIIQKYGLDEQPHLPDVIIHCAIQKWSQVDPKFIDELRPYLLPVPI